MRLSVIDELVRLVGSDDCILFLVLTSCEHARQGNRRYQQTSVSITQDISGLIRDVSSVVSVSVDKPVEKVARNGAQPRPDSCRAELDIVTAAPSRAHSAWSARLI